jgi:hypothetical protein
MSGSIRRRELLPEFATGRGASVADDLPGGATQRDPDPAFVGAFQDE